MSIVIGDFEVVNESVAEPGTSERGNQEPPAKAPSVTPEAFAIIEQYLTERALRVWAD